MFEFKKLDELRSENSRADNPDSERDLYLNEYVQQFLVSHPELYESFIGGPSSSAAAAIANDMGRANDETIIQHIDQILVGLIDGPTVASTSGMTSKEDQADVGADPVMLFKGQFIHQVDDFQIDGAGIDFVLSRTYKNQVLFSGPLGYNWSHNFQVRLRVAEQTIFRTTGDLREEPFVQHPKFAEGLSNDFDYWIPPDGKHSVIFANNVSYILRRPNGSLQVFEPDPNHGFLHRLSRIEDRFGNYLRLEYSNDGDQNLNLIEINHPKRHVTFTYDTRGRICLVSDYTGREWAYSYDSIGDLTSVTSPKTDRYDCGLTANYEYSSSYHSGFLQHNLVRIIDAAGQIYLETEYGTSPGLLNFNRVVRQRQGGGEYLFEYENFDQVFDFEYPDEQRPTHQTILVERNGQIIKHIYNKFGNLLKREQSIVEGGFPRALIEQYRYDRDGNVVAYHSPEGVLTQHLFGRDYFVRSHPLTDNGDVPTDDLTWKKRQAFGQVRATVRRGGYVSFDSFNLTHGTWGDFPDILNGPFPAKMLQRDQDIIGKMTYENEFGQPLTISDPRYTNSANPDEVNEHPRHEDTLTRYTYSGPVQLLVKIKYPTIPFLPDGTFGTEISEKFTNPDPADPTTEIPAYDSNGRLLRSINPVGAVTVRTYFDEQNELSFGHLKQTVLDLDGFNVTVRREIDGLGRAIAVHLPKSVNSVNSQFVTHTVYNELDQVVETTFVAPFHYKTRRFYDRTGNLESEESDLQDENGQPELGGLTVTTSCYDEEFNLVKTTIGGLNLDEHLVTKFCYDNAGNRTLSILPGGNQLRSRYDERQLPVSQISGAGSEDASTTRTGLDGDGRVRCSYDARGNPTSFEFDSFDRVVSVENALGHITRTNFDKAGNATCIRVFEKRGADYFLLSRSEFDFDELNRVILSGVNRFVAPIRFQLHEIDEAALASPGPGELLKTKTIYDENSRIVKTIDPLNRETTFQYDALDRITLATNPLGNQTHNQYDAHSNLIRTNRRDLVLDENGAVLKERHFASSSAYDELDRLVRSTDSLGNVSELFYDSRGNVVRQIDPLLNESRTTYDVFNRAIASSRFLTENGLGPVTPNSVSVNTAQEYDPNGNLIAVIDALGRRTRYEYDELDRRRAIIYPDESKVTSNYDVDNNVIRTQDNNGLRRIHTVDELGRTTRVDVDKSGMLAGLIVAGSTFERYEYDGLNRQLKAENDFSLCSFIYNSLSWQLQETVSFSLDEAPLKTPFTTSRQFNDVGALTELNYPNGRKLRIERDDLDRRISTQNIANGVNYRGDPASIDIRPIAQVSYAGQQRDQCLFANGTSTIYVHDGGARVIEISHAGPNAPILSVQYIYDSANNVRIGNNVLETGPITERFAYDSLYRLALEFKPNTTEIFDLSTFRPELNQLPSPITDSQSAITTLIGPLGIPQMPTTYDYDLVGNREVEILSDGNNIDYDTNQLDQYISRDDTNYSYDKNGNLRLELTVDQEKYFTYDSLNRLTKVSADAAGTENLTEFWHDALGRRILERTDGSVKQLICDGGDVIAEYQDGGLFAQYVFDDGVDRPIQIAAEGEEHWYHADLVGSVRLLTDANGNSAAEYRYTPFGELVGLPANDVFNPWRYTARRFDSELGTYDYRARQYDPTVGRFLQRDKLEMVDGTNLYSYTNSSPIAKKDPSGNNSRPEHNHTSPLSWGNLKDAYSNDSYPKKAIETLNDGATNNTLGLLYTLLSEADPVGYNLNSFSNYSNNLAVWGRNKAARSLGELGSKAFNSFDDLLRYPGNRHPNFFLGKWGTAFGPINKALTILAPLGVYSNYNSIVEPEQASDKLFGIFGFTSSSIGTVGLSGVVMNSIGLTTIAKPLLFVASRLNPIGLVTGAFAGGGLAGQYLDDKTGWSNNLSDRAVFAEKMYREIGHGGTMAKIYGGATNIPVFSEAGEGIGWSASRLVLGATDDNYTYVPWRAAWFPGN